MDILNLFLFAGIAILLAFSPGPDNIYVMTIGITKGKKAAFITTCGLCTGIIFHTLAATLGVSVIFQTSQMAFDILKYLGAAYLIYIAYQAFKHRNEALEIPINNEKKHLKTLYFKGLIMNILNPKVSIFFLAFLPQFISTSSTFLISSQMIVFGIIFLLVTLVVFTSIGFIANIFGKKLLERPSFSKILNYLTSFVLFSLGIKLAFSNQ